MADQSTRFCLEETSFRLDAAVDKENIPSLIEDLTGWMKKLRDEDEQEIARWSQLEFVQMTPELSIADLLYDEAKSPLDKELRLLFMHTIQRCRHWDDDFAPTDASLEAPDSFLESHSLEYVFETNLKHHGVSCLCLKKHDQPIGPLKVKKGDREADIHFVADEESILIFYRSIIETEDLNERRFVEHGRLAFPNLYFAADIHKQFRKFRQDYLRARRLVTRHLSALNDHFRGVYSRSGFQPDLASKEFKTCWDVAMSRESPKTRKNKRAMKEREVVVDNVALCCEWHTKLTPTHDRIHFHQGEEDVADGKIVIGIFAEHLST